jgi:hypothetical protein
MIRWKGFCIAGVVKLTPTKRLHCVRNSSALVRSPLNTCGSLLMNRSEDRGCTCPPVAALGDPPLLGGPPLPGGPPPPGGLPPGRVWTGPLGHLLGSPPPGVCPLPEVRVLPRKVPVLPTCVGSVMVGPLMGVIVCVVIVSCDGSGIDSANCTIALSSALFVGSEILGVALNMLNWFDPLFEGVPALDGCGDGCSGLESCHRSVARCSPARVSSMGMNSSRLAPATRKAFHTLSCHLTSTQTR